MERGGLMTLSIYVLTKFCNDMLMSFQLHIGKEGKDHLSYLYFPKGLQSMPSLAFPIYMLNLSPTKFMFAIGALIC